MVCKFGCEDFGVKEPLVGVSQRMRGGRVGESVISWRSILVGGVM